MKLVPFIILLFSSAVLWSQEPGNFDMGVVIKDISRPDNYSVPLSIVFVFEGDSRLNEYFKDLEKHLREAFEISDIKLTFKYPLESNNASAESKLHESSCTITFNNLNSWSWSKNNSKDYVKKQTYDLSLYMISNATKQEQLTASFLVKTWDTIPSQNKKLAEIVLTTIAIQ